MFFLRSLQGALCVSLLIACVDIQGPEFETLKPDDTLAEVKIRSNAIMIEKGDSQQIAFDLITMDDGRLPVDVDHIKWTSLESQVVAVSPTGMIRGLNVSGGPIIVTVEYVHKYVTRHDTVSVYVTDGRIDANQIKLVSLDSNRMGGTGGAGGIPRVRIDLYKDGTLVSKGALIPIQVDEPAAAAPDAQGGPEGEPVYRITNQKLLIGKFWIRSSLNLYGSEVNDSVSFTGLYGDFVVPAISAYDVSPNTTEPIPRLDTIPLKTYQLCAVQLILNLSMAEVDIVFSDSTASSTGCAPGNPELLNSIGFPSYGEHIGGNVLNMPPFSAAIRKSNTTGVISYTVRNSSTKALLPWFTNHIQQRDVED